MMVAKVIERHSGEILDRWVEGAGRAASARGLTRPQLLDLIPTYLATLGRDGSELPSREQQALLERHLSGRLRQGFDLHEMLVELGVLAFALARLFAEMNDDERPAPPEVASVMSEINGAAMLLTRLFNEHMLEDEQLEKRYGRLIQDVVTEVRHRHRPSTLRFGGRLDDVVTLVREAMMADVVVLSLYEPRGRRLTPVAASGIDAAELGHAAIPPDAKTFLGLVAQTTSGPVHVNAQTVPLELPQALRRAGVRALLGVRLPASDGLLGVMCVGRRDTDTFSATEMRRFESLADRLALHLDNADLYAQLDERMTQLETFIDLLAHDLRGPLTGAKLAIERLLQDSASVERHAGKALTKLAAIERLIDDLLDAHRIAGGELLPLEPIEADVESVAQAIADDANAGGQPRVIVRASGRLRGCFGVAEMRRALSSLVANALERGDANAPVIVSVSGDDEGVVLSVHDEGETIPPEEQERLWRPFARAREPVASRWRGWGLTLALAHGCAAMHGGSAWLDSAAGEGTTVHLAIPWQQPAKEPGARPGEPAHP